MPRNHDWLKNWVQACIDQASAGIIEIADPPRRPFDERRVFELINSNFPICAGIEVAYGMTWFDDTWLGPLAAVVGKGGLTNLQRLGLGGTQVSDNGLKSVGKLTSLKRLYLGGTQVSDDGLESLEKLTSLQSLGRKATQISDGGLKSLAEAVPPLAKLQYLFLTGSFALVPPEVIDSGDAQAIFRAVLEKKERPLGEVKVLIVGQG